MDLYDPGFFARCATLAKAEVAARPSASNGEITLEFAASCVAEIAAQLIGCQHESGESGAAKRLILARRLMRKAQYCVDLVEPSAPPDVAAGVDLAFASHLMRGWIDRITSNSLLSNDEVRERLNPGKVPIDWTPLSPIPDRPAQEIGFGPYP